MCSVGRRREKMFPVLSPETAHTLFVWSYVASMILLVWINVYNHLLNKWFIGPPKPPHLYDD
jgi:hypothetical protein